MFNFIYNDSRCTKNIREAFYRQFQEDYEYAYTAIKNKWGVNGTNVLKFQDEDFNAFEEIIENVYELLHESINREICKNSNRECNLLKLTFDNIIKPIIDNKGHLITLNQDILLETIVAEYSNNLNLIYPGLKFGNDFNLSMFKYNKDSKLNKYKLSISAEIDTKVGNLNCDNNNIAYIKVHGSSHWYSENDKQLILFGSDKHLTVGSNPYFDLLNNQIRSIFSDKVKLLVIGYSFSDENINQILYNSIDNIDMTVIDVLSPSEFFSKRPKLNCFDFKNLKYFSLDLKKLLSDNLYLELFKKSFFNL